MNILFHLKALWSKVVAWFGATKKVRLSVVGFTASGKTYLQTDVVGALEKLGFRCDDRYANDHLQRDVYNLIEEMDRDGAVGKSLVKACRQEDVYLSRFLDRNDKAVMVEFVDVPGEVLVPDSLKMFRALMKAMMACREKIFTSTQWVNVRTGKSVKVVGVSKGVGGSGPVDLLDGAVSGSRHGSSDTQREYVSAATREAYYKRMGFTPGKVKKVDGKKIFCGFLDYDTDSVVQAIIQAWGDLKVDSVLPKELLAQGGGSGKNLFSKEYKNHFFYHYYTFYSTDVIVCDKCCMPVMDSEGTEEVKDIFPVMMMSLKSMTEYEDLPTKNWYLAIKGVDAFMQEQPFREVFSLSGGDFNLVYSHFTTLLRQACIHDLWTGGVSYVSPFSSDEAMMRWLTGNRTLDHRQELVDLLRSHYDLLGTDIERIFKNASEYCMETRMTLREYLANRFKNFVQADTRLQNTKGRDDEMTLLDMPRHVFFVSTPIDDTFHICGHEPGTPTSFEGSAKYYNQRADFGTLQLVASIMTRNEMSIGINKNVGNIGFVLTDNMGINV